MRTPAVAPGDEKKQECVYAVTGRATPFRVDSPDRPLLNTIADCQRENDVDV